MPARLLIDLTDARLFIRPNDAVIAFIRRANPFAHSDVGSLLFGLGKSVPGAVAYCPAPANYAYVVLHTAENVVFAIAYDMTGLASRLDGASYDEALADGGVPQPEIGADWVRFHPWPPGVPEAETRDRLHRWCMTGFRLQRT